jgi:glycosyltransferase involved in cell wall biosynthesis
LMEAGIHGVTLVSTPVSGVTELIEDGVTGVIVPPDDPTILSGALERLARHPTERYRLGRDASRKVLRLFDHDRAMRGLIDLFPASLRSGVSDVGSIAAE